MKRKREISFFFFRHENPLGLLSEKTKLICVNLKEAYITCGLNYYKTFI